MLHTLVVDAGKFNWNNGKFPDFTEPSEGYHGLKFWETFGNLAFTYRLKTESLRDIGACLNPFGSFLLLQGMSLYIPDNQGEVLCCAVEAQPTLWINRSWDSLTPCSTPRWQCTWIGTLVKDPWGSQLGQLPWSWRAPIPCHCQKVFEARFWWCPHLWRQRISKG